MFSALVERIKTTLTAWKLSKLPAVRIGRELIKNNWTESHETIKDFSPEFVKRQGDLMMEEIVKMAALGSSISRLGQLRSSLGGVQPLNRVKRRRQVPIRANCTRNGNVSTAQGRRRGCHSAGDGEAKGQDRCAALPQRPDPQKAADFGEGKSL